MKEQLHGTGVTKVYAAKDRVVDRYNIVWQYNALFGTFSSVSARVLDYYSPEALEKHRGPLVAVNTATPVKPKLYTARFEVTVTSDVAFTPDEKRVGMSHADIVASRVRETPLPWPCDCRCEGVA